MREFTLGDLHSMRIWRPDALVAPLDLVLTLADQKQRGSFELPDLSTAIVVLTRTEDSPLADHHRDLLWYAFAVPVFEQLRDGDGNIAAVECEVHDGLHLCHGQSLTPEGELVVDPCPCGLESARVRRYANYKKPAAATMSRIR